MSDYVLEGPRWSGGPITWSFAEATYPQDDAQPFSSAITGDYQASVLEAVQRWASVANIPLVQVPDNSDPAQAPDIRVGFGALDGSGTGVIGQTNYSYYTDGGTFVPDVVVRLEDPGELALSPDGNGGFSYDGYQATLYQDALHEIGHALGLAHSPDPGSIMSPSLSADDPDLSASDIAGVQALYGASGEPAAPTPAATADNGGTAATAADDTLVLRLSEDMWQGNAQAAVFLDGQSLGGPQTITASHAEGETQALAFAGPFGPGSHDVEVAFLNDAWGGTPDTDRNLYVDSVSLGGHSSPDDVATLYTNGTATFTVGDAKLSFAQA